MFTHTDAAYLIADSILGELTFVRKALEAAGCERVYASGDEAEALALIERERIDLVLVAWDAYHDGLELLYELRRKPEHRQLPVLFIFEASVEPERLARLTDIEQVKNEKKSFTFCWMLRQKTLKDSGKGQQWHRSMWNVWII